MTTIVPSDIETALGRPASSPAEQNQWQMWINHAELLISTRFGGLESLDPALVDYVVLQAVLAHVRKPDDATQVDMAVDDARVSRRYSSGNGRVTILDEWWDLLSPRSTGGAFTISPTGAPDYGWRDSRPASYDSRWDRG